MKRLFIIQAFLTLLFSGVAQAQGFSSNNPFDGLHKTFSDFFQNKSTPKEAMRLLMLRSSDIRLEINVEWDEERFGIGNEDLILFSTITTATKESLECRFDWDNLTLAMIGESAESTTSFRLLNQRLPDKVNPGGRTIQFTDKYGYWYVPGELEPGKYIYIKFHIKNTAKSLIGDLIDLTSEENIDDLYNSLLVLLAPEKNREFIYDLMGMFGVSDEDQPKILGLFPKIDETEIQEELKELLRDIEKERFSNIIGFPVFIHWALLYSPDYVKSKADVTESQFDCYGMPGACTLLTISSGPDKGKSLRFDPYDRLIFIDAKKEGTAAFTYGHDFNIRLPEAYTMEDIMSGKVIIPEKR